MLFLPLTEKFKVTASLGLGDRKITFMSSFEDLDSFSEELLNTV